MWWTCEERKRGALRDLGDEDDDDDDDNWGWRKEEEETSLREVRQRSVFVCTCGLWLVVWSIKTLLMAKGRWLLPPGAKLTP